MKSVIRTSEFVNEAVKLIVAEGHAAIAARGLFRLSLCGGGTPRPVYAALAQSDLPWERVQVTFGDERCVPPDDAQSNYRMAREAFLDAIQLPEGNVFRMQGELDPAEAASLYGQRLAQVASRMGEERYRHDLLLLGMGDDGHTASLFPGTEALAETERDVVANFVPKFDTWRITMTYPLINAARHVAFLLNDPKKDPIVAEIEAGNSGHPAEKVAPTDGRLTWIVGNGN